MVKKQLIEITLEEVLYKHAKKNYDTNESAVNYFDDTWSLDILELIDYGIQNNGSYRSIVVENDSLSKNGCSKILKSTAQVLTFEIFRNTWKSNRKSSRNGTDNEEKTGYKLSI